MDASYELQEKPSQSGRDTLDSIVWRKLDGWVLPLLTIFFLLAAVDRTNIANARVAGMQTSLAMSNRQFTMALTVTSVPFMTSELPSTLLVNHVGPNIMLPAMVTLWGVVSAAQGLVRNYSELLACRFLLGIIEGGLVPGIILYLSVFYPRKRLQIRVTIFVAAISLTGAFSGLLAAAIDQVNGKGGKPGWAWIFILEGAFTFVFGLISFFLLPRSPEKARFFTEKERAYVISTLKRAGSVSENDSEDRFSWMEVVRSLKSPHVWFIAVAGFSNGAIFLGLAFFEPTIVAGLGYVGNHAQLMSVPPFAVTFVLSMVSAVVSDRYQCRGYTSILFALLIVIGFVMFYASTSNHIRYASLFFSVAGAYGGSPAQITWMANNSTPQTRRATALAMTFTSVESGGLLATWLLGSISAAPDYRSASITFIVMSISTVMLLTANLVYLWRENKMKEKRRRRMKREEEEEGVGDRSAWFVYSL